MQKIAQSEEDLVERPTLAIKARINNAKQKKNNVHMIVMEELRMRKLRRSIVFTKKLPVTHEHYI